MANDPTPEFDLGPLSWVQGEIDQALTRGLEAIAQFRANPIDGTSLKHARSHVHQAAGAIQMVGLDAVVAFTDELERQLTRLEELPPSDIAAACDVVDRACLKLKIFLDELVNGAPPVPLKLYPEYEAMQGARGIRAAAPTDLFYPDLSPRAPRISAREAVSPNRLPSFLVKQRRSYQRGLLAWLRGDEGGAATMRDAIAGIEDVTTQGSLRAFWWTVGAMFEGLVEGGLDSGFGVKQLAARIDLQIRRVAEGSAKVADRLRREVLYFAAICAPVGPQVQAVQRAFKLSGLIPSAEVLSADVVRLQPLLREAREQLAGAKDAWLKTASGRAENLPKLKHTLASVHAKAAEIHNGALMKLTAALVERLDRMPATGVSEPVAMEYATALLLAESAFENYSSLSTDFPKQVDAMLARLDSARQGLPSTASGAPMLDEMSKRAQERVLLAQVGREIQANLRHMEQVLDAFFRDNTKRGDLATLAKDSTQIRGALRILGLNDADRLLELCEQQIATYSDPDATVSNDDLELLAESLSGLGFYIEAVEQQRPDRDRLIAPLIAKRLGEAPAPAAPEQDSVEAAVAELRAALPQLVDEVHRAPSDAAAREGLKQKLANLRDDAELIGDAELVAQAGAVLAELEAGDAARLAAAVEAISDTSAPAPEISEETQRLLATDASELDRELLEIYLSEAAEVLDGIAQNHRILSDNPGDREALRTIRRGFHTLKGSGRMVGLTELGEYAYRAEHVFNRLLEEERPVTGAVLALVDTAHRSFRDWVDALTNEGRVTADPREFDAAIAAVERELPGGSPQFAPAPAPAPAAPSNVIEMPRSPHAAHAHVEGPERESKPAAPTTRPTLELIELPELGFSDDEPGPAVVPVTPFAETIEMIDVSPARTLKLVEETTVAHVERTPVEWTEDAREATPECDEIAIGDVVLSRSLWTILCDEADQHLATLRNELAILQFDSRAVPRAAMVRASHTLCGIHRTGGFPVVAATAKALEQTLIALEQHGAPLPGMAQPILARAIENLALLVSRVKTQVPFTRADSDEATAVQLELDELRQEAATEAGDAEAAALFQARLDDDAVASTSVEGARPPPVSVPSIAGDAAVPSSPAEIAPSAAAEAVPSKPPGVSADSNPVDTVSSPVDEAGATSIPAETAPTVADEAVPSMPHGVAADSTPTETALSLADEAEAALRSADIAFSSMPIESDSFSSSEIAPPAPIETASASMPGEVPPSIAPVSSIASTDGTPTDITEDIGIVLPAIEADPLADIDDDVDVQVLPIFLDEAAELFPRAGEEVRAWRRSPGDESAPARLRRTLHTFKGSARMAGAMRLGHLAHLMESRLSEDDAAANAAPQLFDLLDEDLDNLAFVLDALRRGEFNKPLPWVAQPEEASATESESMPADATVLPAAPPAIERPIVVPLAPVVPSLVSPRMLPASPTPPSVAPAPAEPAPEMEMGARAQLRVRADVVDRLVNEAGEVAIARARVEGELRSLKANLLELTNSVIRLRAQMREIEIQAESQIQSQMQLQEQHGEFDPLEFDRYTRFQELTRSLAEGINDVSTVQQSLLKNLDDADAALLAQARMSREVQQRLFSIRTVPFGSLSERLYRILRSTARELDKRANLEIQGSQVELDRSVLEKLVGPLEHLLRNALDHGIEPRDVRRSNGKSETGEVSLTVRQVGNEVVIELADDGRGIDFAQVRERAEAMGMIAPDAAPTETQLVECLFAPGFTTAQKVTQVSGRGIGMDVVRSEVGALGGRVEVVSAKGMGTRFVLTLPLTLAVAQAVMVRAGGRLWALPAPMVEQVQQVKSQALLDIYIQRKVDWQGRTYPFHYLPRLLGDASHNPETKRYNAVLLLRSGQSHAAVHVDEMIGNQEVVVKNIGPQLARVSGISGATVLGTGEIVLIINPVQLAGRADIPKFDPRDDERAIGDHPRAPVAPVSTLPLVMIVDDSLTVRKITSRLLQREGFAVTAARDGVDALQVLAEQVPDVILLDIEMPRMDGFEFAKTIKGDPKYASIPIIMITSRTAEKHRNRAAELGVDLYLGKPYQEDELLRHLRDMTGAGVMH
jgi:chemosensory pili system protein ChpA (sensor histidine kinase/response regulator)